MMTLRLAVLAAGLLALASCAGDSTNPDEELPEPMAIFAGTVLTPDGTVPDVDEYDPYAYVIRIWTEGFGCGNEWEGHTSRRVQADGSWVGAVAFPAVFGPVLGDSVCTHVTLLTPPASPWRVDTISVGGLELRKEPPYDSAEVHFVLKPKEDTAASR